MFKRFLLTIAGIIPVFSSPGQDTAVHNMAVSAGIHRGFLLAHRPLIVPLQKDHITGAEIGLIRKTDGSKPWHQVYGFPETGLSISWWNLGNEEQLGFGLAVIPYLDFPLTGNQKTSFDLKFGWGLGYIEKTFDADENHKNVAIGSHLNCALILQPHIKTEISERLTVHAGLSLTHFSNGSIATPNLGLNLVSVTAGMSGKFGPPNRPVTTALSPFEKSRRFVVFAAAAMKQVYPADGNDYFAGILSVNHSWQKTRKSSYGFGADIFYDESIHKKLEERNMKLNHSLEQFRGGLHAGYELAISDLSIVFNMGCYLYSKLSNDGMIYQRFGLRYRFSERIFGAFHLKSHWGKADFFEWGLGYRIDKMIRK